MCGEKMKICLDDTIELRPCQITTARQVPIHMREMTSTLMEELERSGAVRRYDGPMPSTFPCHFVLKACGKKVRLVTNYRIVNCFIMRLIRPFSSATDLMRSVLPSSTWFCKLYAIHGYFQVHWRMSRHSSCSSTYIFVCYSLV